jgi:hypothetical protein
VDGKEALYKLRELLGEDADSAFLEDKTSYDYINEAAREFVIRTRCITASQDLTTVEDQRGYTLNADFMELYLMNKQNRHYVLYNDGSSSYSDFIYWKDYEDIILSDSQTSVLKPDKYTIVSDPVLDSQVTGTATSDGAASGGQCTLTDTAADFSDVSAGDIVHNTSDGSDGIVLSKTSTTVLVVALFGGTTDEWTSTNAYVIQPQGRLQLRLDPPPSTAGHTVTVHYIQRPVPVYSDYGVFRFQPQHMEAIIKYAAYQYKFRDREPNFGHIYYQAFERQIRMSGNALNKTFKRNKITVNLRARR